MRLALWPDADTDELASYATRDDYLILLAETDAGDAIGFAEIGVRSVVEGHDHPAAYLEGIWVDPDRRRQGVSLALLDAAQAWAEARGFTHFGSDAEIDNAFSHLWHAAVGFKEVERLVVFGRPLRSSD